MISSGPLRAVDAGAMGSLLLLFMCLFCESFSLSASASCWCSVCLLPFAHNYASV